MGDRLALHDRLRQAEIRQRHGHHHRRYRHGEDAILVRADEAREDRHRRDLLHQTNRRDHQHDDGGISGMAPELAFDVGRGEHRVAGIGIFRRVHVHGNTLPARRIRRAAHSNHWKQLDRLYRKARNGASALHVVARRPGAQARL